MGIVERHTRLRANIMEGLEKMGSLAAVLEEEHVREADQIWGLRFVWLDAARQIEVGLKKPYYVVREPDGRGMKETCFGDELSVADYLKTLLG